VSSFLSLVSAFPYGTLSQGYLRQAYFTEGLKLEPEILNFCLSEQEWVFVNGEEEEDEENKGSVIFVLSHLTCCPFLSPAESSALRPSTIPSSFCTCAF